MKPELEEPHKNIAKVLESIVHSLVDSPNEVSIEPEYNEAAGVTVFHILTGNERDAHKLIGRQGRTARSIRTILSACSMKYKLHFAIAIEDLNNSTRRAGRP